MKPDTLIWDLGNVLIRWNPRLLFDKIFDDKEQEDYFLEHICTGAWRNQVDGGRDTREATETLLRQHPRWEAPIRAFYERWPEMFGGAITGSVELLGRLKELGRRQYALSNWSAELFAHTRSDYPFLEWFDGIVLSGSERLTKPEPAIYRVLLERYSVEPARAVFIDDRAENVATARLLGMHGIVFENEGQLNVALAELGLL